ncbi:MAG: glycosyltransferase [Flavobacteriaceae bacterium]|nr:glycosyltransferase [Flavobacteriaceae bacterium]
MMDNRRKHIAIMAISMNIGGTERVISLLLPKLVKDYRVSLVLLSEEIAFDIPSEVNIHVLGSSEKVLTTSPLQKIWFTLGYFRKYYRLVKRERFDVSLSFLALPNFINSAVANLFRNPKIRTIISERCYPSQMYARSRFSMIIARIFYPLLYNRNDMLFSNSVYINNDLKNRFGVKIPMAVVYNPVKLKPLEKELSATENRKIFNVINVGSHVFVKNQMMILKAINRLDDTYVLTLLGDGNLTDSMTDFAIDTGISKRLNMRGRVGNVENYLSESDCFVLSSRTEGFPNVILEAMANGVPVISTNCMSGPLEILNDNQPVQIEKGGFVLARYGVLVNVDDDDGLAQALEFLKSHPDKRLEYINLGLQKAQEFDLTVIYKKFKDLIENKD